MAQSRSSAPILALALALVVAGGAVVALVLLRAPDGPALAAIEPARARIGDTVTLKGSRFGPTSPDNIVLFGDHAGRVISASEQELRVEVPEVGIDAGSQTTVAVRVVVGTRSTPPRDFAVYREAAVAEAMPAEPAPEPVPEEVTAAASPAPATASGAPAAAPKAQKPAARAAPAQPAPARPAGGESAASAPAIPPPAAPAIPPAQRRFVLERTSVESKKRVDADLVGFDTAGVNVKRAPDVVARVDFEVTPPQVKPGDKYTVKVYLINDGKKPIKVKDLFIATSINGRLASGPVAPATRDVAPRQKQVLGSFSDSWKDTTASWAMDVTVTSDRGDVYKNQIIWR